MSPESVSTRSRSDISSSSRETKKHGRARSLTNPQAGIAAQKELDPYFKPINILVYRNGDEHDPGYVATVTRKQFRNWVSFLEELTEKTNTFGGAVHYVYTTDGKECRHFRDLDDGGKYVAAVGAFKPVTYGHKPPKYGTKPQAKWNYEQKPPTDATTFLESEDSKAHYLHKKKFDGNTKDMWEDDQWDKKMKAKHGGTGSGSVSSSQPDLSVPKPYLHRSRSSMYRLKPTSMFPKIGDARNVTSAYSGSGSDPDETGRFGNGRVSSTNGQGHSDGDSVAELILVTAKGDLLSLPIHGSFRNTDELKNATNLGQKPPKPKSSGRYSKASSSRKSRQNSSLSDQDAGRAKKLSSLSNMSRKTYT